MNFKDEYKRDYSQIAADEEFINQLEKKMNNTAPAKINIKMITAAVSAVAVIALAIGAGTAIPDEKDGGIALKGETAVSQTLTEGLFDIDVWYGHAESDDEIYAVFAGLISEGSLETLYCSDDSMFDDTDIPDRAEMNELAEKLAAAVRTNEKAIGAEKRCMAVFSSGEIVKFSIWDNGIVKLDDCAEIYKIN